ncbi:hypothetical protein ACVD55_004075 [Vibrio alginolyticus]|nr:hypothetical protein [Vibrio alginolyticus]
MPNNYLIRLILILFSLLLFSSNASASSVDVKLCDNCGSNDSWYAFAKQHHKFMSTVEFHVYNPNTDILKKFVVTNKQYIQPNGEPIFNTTATMYNPEPELRNNISIFMAEKEAIGEQVVASMALSLDVRDYYIELPESIASSPWDLVGSSYSMNQITNYLDPANEASFWYDEMGDAFGAQALAYIGMGFNLTLTELLGFDRVGFDMMTVKFASGAIMTFNYSFDGAHYFDLAFTANYPILDANGNVVAESPAELNLPSSFFGDYLFEGEGGAVDRNSFESLLERSGFEVIENGTYSDGAVLRCYNVYVGGQNIGRSCVKL